MTPTPTARTLRPLRAAMTARFHRMRRRAQREQAKGRGRFVGIVLTGLIIAAAVFLLAYAGGRYVLSRHAAELSVGAVATCLLVVTSALLLSSIGHAANAFFTAQDLWFWDCAPASKTARFIDRFTDALIAAAPATLSLGMLFVLGFLIGVGADVATWARAVVSVVLMATVPVSVGVTIAHLGAAVLPAGALRRLSLVLVGVATCGGLVYLRRVGLDDALTESGAARLLERARGTYTVGPAFLPHNVGARFIVENRVSSAAAYLLWVGGAGAAAYVSHVTLFLRGRKRSTEGDDGNRAKLGVSERIATWYAQRFSRNVAIVITKDLLSLIRDPSEWGQLLLLLGIAVVYIVNCAALYNGFGALPIGRDVFLPALHVGVVGFIAAGLAARFAFPQIGKEGSANYMPRAAPLTARDWFMGKTYAALPLVVGFPTAVGVVGGVVLQLPPALLVSSSLCIFLSAFAICFLASARGSISPAFDAAHIGELAMGPGAISAMMLALAIAFFVSVGFFVVALALRFGGSVAGNAFATCIVLTAAVMTRVITRRAIMLAERSIAAYRNP